MKYLQYLFLCLAACVPAKSFAQQETESRVHHEVGLNMVQLQSLNWNDLYFVPGIFYRFHLFDRFHLRACGARTVHSYSFSRREPNVQSASVFDYKTGKFTSCELRLGAGYAVVAKERFRLYGFAEWGLRMTTHDGRYGYNGVDYEDDYQTTGIGASFGPGLSYRMWKGLTITCEADWAVWIQKTNYHSRGSVTPLYASTEFFPVSTLGISWRL